MHKYPNAMCAVNHSFWTDGGIEGGREGKAGEGRDEMRANRASPSMLLGFPSLIGILCSSPRPWWLCCPAARNTGSTGPGRRRPAPGSVASEQRKWDFYWNWSIDDGTTDRVDEPETAHHAGQHQTANDQDDDDQDDLVRGGREKGKEGEREG